MKNLKFLLLFLCSVLFFNYNVFAKVERKNNHIKKKSQTALLHIAVMNADIKIIQAYIKSGKSIATINRSNAGNSSIIYDALFIKNEDARNIIIDLLLHELKKEKYQSTPRLRRTSKNIKEDYINRKNYHNKQEKPMTALEKAFNLGYMDIAQKLIEAGAHCNDSDQFDINYFYALVTIQLLQQKFKEDRDKS